MRKRGKSGGGGGESLGARWREEDEEGRLRRERGRTEEETGLSLVTIRQCRDTIGSIME